MYRNKIESFITQQQYPGFNPKAIFFDMDGVLFDSMKFHSLAWESAMNDVNIPFTRYEAYMNEGRTGHSTIDDAFMRHLNRTATEEEKQLIYKLKTKYFEELGPTEKMPFAHDLLNKVQSQELQIFIVTGSGQLSLIDSLENAFPAIFRKDRMITAFDVEHGKPHPEPYLKALAKSGVEPWEAVVIENAPLGIESAVAAGLFTLAVNTGPIETKILYQSGAHHVFDGGMQELNEKWSTFTSLNL
jgi:HAD superfamily hydrolase (TIGR01509 family)